MSSASNDQGRAYEYAWIKTLESVLSPLRPTQIVHNSSYEANLSAWNKMTPLVQQIYKTSADAAVHAVLSLSHVLKKMMVKF